MKHIITVSILFILSLLQTIQAKGKDEYWYTPKASPEERKESFLKYYAEHGRKDFLTGILNQRYATAPLYGPGKNSDSCTS